MKGFAGAPIAPIVVDGDTYKFSFLYRTSSVNEAVMLAENNPLSDDDPTTYGFGNGLCSEGYPGPAGIDGLPFPLSGEFFKGDTVIVEARKAPDAAGVVGPNTLNGTGTILSIDLTVNGVPFDGVNGTLTTTADDGDGLSFSFTSN